jgi:hypothetical protein
VVVSIHYYAVNGFLVFELPLANITGILQNISFIYADDGDDDSD